MTFVLIVTTYFVYFKKYLLMYDSKKTSLLVDHTQQF